MPSSLKIWRAFLNLFFPHICYACGSDLVSDHQILCLRCLHRLPYTRFERIAENPIEKIFWGRTPIEHAASLLYFTKGSVVERLLYQLKYRGKKEVGIYCGRLMGEAIRNAEVFGQYDSIVPLPLFKKREHARGFNQAKIIAEGMAMVLKIPVLDDVVERVQATESQTHKNRIERWQNMRERFRINAPEKIANTRILLIDDVITTGATLESCATELLKADQVRLGILTLGYSSSKNV
jgi:ComF family protein